MNLSIYQYAQAQRHADFLREASNQRLVAQLFRERPLQQPVERALRALIFRLGFWIRVHFALQFL